MIPQKNFSKDELDECTTTVSPYPSCKLPLVAGLSIHYPGSIELFPLNETGLPQLCAVVPGMKHLMESFCATHRYNATHIKGLQSLKGRDLAVAALLHELAHSKGVLDVRLVTLQRTRSGGYCCRSHERDYGPSWSEMEDIEDKWTVSGWQTLQGEKMSLHGSCAVSESELMQVLMLLY